MHAIDGLRLVDVRGKSVLRYNRLMTNFNSVFTGADEVCSQEPDRHSQARPGTFSLTKSSRGDGRRLHRRVSTIQTGFR